ncbi:MAG: polysaccharide deacetylase family protein [Spirochaetales bacterium]|nr:polysaccharide deacetylase family protein [Spirochaetales bacterium]
MRRLTVFLIAGILCAGSLAGEVGFAGLDLSSADGLLFRAGTDSPRYGAYDTLFLAGLEEGTLTQLTVFPEEVVVLPGEAGVQVQNRFGVFRSDPQTGTLEPVEMLSSFVRDGRVGHGAPAPLQVSPDGRYVLRFELRTPAFGDLLLMDLAQKGETVVASGVEIDLGEPPCAWSPLSDYFVYSRAGTLYYFSIRQLADGRVLAEEYRRVGEGRIRNVRWSDGGVLYYLSGSLVYRMVSRELFTRALYAGYLPIGELVGKIPFSFDPNFDSFWVAPNEERILLDKGGRNLFLYPLRAQDFSATGTGYALPYLYLPRSRTVKRVVWPRSGALAVLTEGIQNGRPRRAVYRLQGWDQEGPTAFVEMPEQPRDLVLSPDGSTIAAVLEDRVTLIDPLSWRPGNSRLHEDPLHVRWCEDGRLVVAGSRLIERWDPESGRAVLIGLSQAGAYSFSEDESAVLMKLGEGSYRRGLAEPGWEAVAELRLRDKRTASPTRRVYLEEALSDPYRNLIMIRDARGFGTRPLLPAGAPEFEPFPERDEPLDSEVFSHGARIRRREVALAFNAIDSIEGLAEILSVLGEYNIRATFFVNGEVIRRHPDAVREIAEAGHEVGSLFYVYFNMTDSRFRLDREFIKRGLARNEDDYYAATGRELSLLWHAPYYFVNSDIVAASAEMNYAYVGRDVDPLDWVTRRTSLTAQDIYLSAGQIVERVMEQKKPGSIVPIRIGIPEGGREDYLFQKVDLLIDALLKRGYRVVPVTTLIEHAR